MNLFHHHLTEIGLLVMEFQPLPAMKDIQRYSAQRVV